MVAEVGTNPTPRHGVESYENTALGMINNESAKTVNHRGETPSTATPERQPWTRTRPASMALSPAPSGDKPKIRGRAVSQPSGAPGTGQKDRSRSGQRPELPRPPDRRTVVNLPDRKDQDGLLRLGALEEQNVEDERWAKGMDDAVRFLAHQVQEHHEDECGMINGANKRADFVHKRVDDLAATMKQAEDLGFPHTFGQMGKKIIEMEHKILTMERVLEEKRAAELEQQAAVGELQQKLNSAEKNFENKDMDVKISELQQAIDKTVELADGALKRNETNIQEVHGREEAMEKRVEQLQRDLFLEFGSLRSKAAGMTVVESPPGMVTAASGPQWATLSANVNRAELDGMGQRLEAVTAQMRNIESNANAQAQDLSNHSEELLKQIIALASKFNTRPCHCIHLDALDKHVRGEITEKVDKVMDELKKTHTNMGEQCTASQANPSFLGQFGTSSGHVLASDRDN